MLQELWRKHRGAFCFAVGMACFLAAGFMVQSLPKVREKLEEAGSLPPRSSTQNTTESPSPKTLPQSSEPAAETPNEGEGGAPVQASNEWFLYITGSVRNPGVYKLPPGARLFQLVEAAGGLNNFADTVAINMAAPLEDGMHVHVPKKGERPTEAPNPAIIVEPTIIPPVSPRSGLRLRNEAASRSSVIDINRATLEDLTRLKGIGPALAKNIMDYRTRNGRFRYLEDLLQVKGIGSKKLEGFRNFVTVGP